MNEQSPAGSEAGEREEVSVPQELDSDPLFLPYQQKLVSAGNAPSISEGARKLPLPIGGAKSFKELTGEYAFFSPALLYLSGHWNDSFWAPLQDELKSPLTLYTHRCQSVIFDGLRTLSGDDEWNSTLWAVPKKQWGNVIRWVLSNRLLSLVLQDIMMFGWQEFDVVDALAVDCRAPIEDKLKVVFFSVHYRSCSYGLDRSYLYPLLVKAPPLPQVQVTYQALIQNRSPFKAMENEDQIVEHTRSVRSARRSRVQPDVHDQGGQVQLRLPGSSDG